MPYIDECDTLGQKTESEQIHKVCSSSWVMQLVDHHRILELVRPFITCVDPSDTHKRQVGVLHQSIREFVVNHHATRRDSHRRFSSEKSTGNTSNSTFLGSSSAPNNELLEASMLDICLRYLALYEIGRNQLFSVDQMAIEELPQETDLFNKSTQPVEYTPHCSWEEWEKSMTGYDPSERGFGDFFVYASCYWLEHYEKNRKCVSRQSGRRREHLRSKVIQNA